MRTDSIIRRNAEIRQNNLQDSVSWGCIKERSKTKEMIVIIITLASDGDIFNDLRISGKRNVIIILTIHKTVTMIFKYETTFFIIIKDYISSNKILRRIIC